jgi:hypothetical protein
LTVERLALALEAAAVSYRSCAPQLPDYFRTVAMYLVNPDAAVRRIKSDQAMQQKIGRVW